MGCNSLVKHLPSILKSLGFLPSALKRRGREKEERQREREGERQRHRNKYHGSHRIYRKYHFVNWHSNCNMSQSLYDLSSILLKKPHYWVYETAIYCGRFSHRDIYFVTGMFHCFFQYCQEINTYIRKRIYVPIHIHVTHTDAYINRYVCVRDDRRCYKMNLWKRKVKVTTEIIYSEMRKWKKPWDIIKEVIGLTWNTKNAWYEAGTCPQLQFQISKGKGKLKPSPQEKSFSCWKNRQNHRVSSLKSNGEI